jgi:hypothetical protein
VAVKFGAVCRAGKACHPFARAMLTELYYILHPDTDWTKISKYISTNNRILYFSPGH